MCYRVLGSSVSFLPNKIVRYVLFQVSVSSAVVYPYQHMRKRDQFSFITCPTIQWTMTSYELCYIVFSVHIPVNYSAFLPLGPFSCSMHFSLASIVLSVRQPTRFARSIDSVLGNPALSIMKLILLTFSHLYGFSALHISLQFRTSRLLQVLVCKSWTRQPSYEKVVPSDAPRFLSNHSVDS